MTNKASSPALHSECRDPAKQLADKLLGTIESNKLGTLTENGHIQVLDSHRLTIETENGLYNVDISPAVSR